jgi:LAS superfamily LD-carboxypeptidase LdcB
MAGFLMFLPTKRGCDMRIAYRYGFELRLTTFAKYELLFFPFTKDQRTR